MSILSQFLKINKKKDVGREITEMFLENGERIGMTKTLGVG